MMTQICAMDSSHEKWESVAAFAENCSWGAGKTLARLMRTGAFKAWERVFAAFENGKPAEVAVEKVGLSFNNADDAVNRFLQWILEKGTKYNHEYGLLNLDRKETNVQIHHVQSRLTAHLESLGK